MDGEEGGDGKVGEWREREKGGNGDGKRSKRKSRGEK